MKKLTLLFALCAITGLFGAEGEAIFKAKCSACHMLTPPAGMMKGPGTPEFKDAMASLKAPPMVKVAQMAKMRYPDKEAFVNFVTDYITNPQESKTVCMKKAIKGFGLMPPIGKSMSDAEKKAVAEWIYTLKPSKKMQMMKCGEGKCGEGKCGMNKAKQMMKCGAAMKEKAKTMMKCGAGKCGGSMMGKGKEMMQEGKKMMKEGTDKMQSKCGTGMMEKAKSMMKCGMGK